MRLLATLLLLMYTTSAFADPTAIVAALRGDVQVNQKSIAVGDELHEGDTVTTGDRSFTVLQFVDGAKVTIRPSSVLVIDQYADNRAQINLVQGGLRMVTGAWAKSNPEDYRVKTPVALMGVRGTEFSVQLCNDQCVDEL